MTGERVRLIRVKEGGRYGCAIKVITEGRIWWIRVSVDGGYGCSFPMNTGLHPSWPRNRDKREEPVILPEWEMAQYAATLQ